MAIIVSQIDTPVHASKEDIIEQALRKLQISADSVEQAAVHKTSLDARKQDKIKLVSSVYLRLKASDTEARLCKSHPFCAQIEPAEFSPVLGKHKANGRIVIAGFGPAGMFAALTLAEYGYKPVVFERGDEVSKRVQKVQSFWQGGKLDTESNVQFGEGGAGTFSDGKLTTRIKDPLCAHVLKKFVEFGAPEEILTKAKPHIGTDHLRGIVKAIRERVLSLGGEIHFNTAVRNIFAENNTLTQVEAGAHNVAAQALILAIGHSARDTFEMLMNKGVFLEPKAFSVGARIEHTQESVNRSLYGKHSGNPLLPQGEYQLSHRDDGRGVYTFCMCPGGTVVPAASEENSVVTNGMSEFARNQVNANSALVVAVTPQDFGSQPLDGVRFAREIEQKAFRLGGQNYKAPAVSVGSFLEHKTEIFTDSVSSSYSIGVTPADFDALFPDFVTRRMREGLSVFARYMSCFQDRNALLTGPETRTSSPVRITRGEDFQSIKMQNLYPCGEGAGYAGGIMSAAVDGIRIALKIMEIYAP